MEGPAALAGGEYAEWCPRAALRRFVQCTWKAGPADPDAEPVLPDGCMDVIWNGVRLFVAGPDTGPVADDHGGDFAVGLRFRPGMAPLFLGTRADELRGARVELDQLWPEAPVVAERLAEASSDMGVGKILEEAVLARLATEPEPDPVVESAAHAWSMSPALATTASWATTAALATTASWASTASLAAAAGVSDRQLHRRFVAAVGYGPKYLQRVLRFQAFLALCSSPDLGLADLAQRCGYADQAHLTRETALLAGRTPGRLRAARRAGVRNVQDGT